MVYYFIGLVRRFFSFWGVNLTCTHISTPFLCRCSLHSCCSWQKSIVQHARFFSNFFFIHNNPLLRQTSRRCHRVFGGSAFEVKVGRGNRFMQSINASNTNRFRRATQTEWCSLFLFNIFFCYIEVCYLSYNIL